MNGRAGALLGQGESADALEALLRGAADEIVVIPPDSGTLPDRLAQARAGGAECVVVAGGDGTIACAAQILAGSGIALGLIPGGTMNLLARDLKIDPADRAGATRLIGEGRARPIDVGEVVGAGDMPHLFLCASMLGTPARLSRHRESGRQHGNGPRAWAKFAQAAARALHRNRSMRLVLRCNGQVLKRRTPSLTITVNALDDSSGRLFGRAALDGGELVLYLVPRGSVLAQLGLLLRAALTGRLRAPDIEIIRTTALEIDGPVTAFHVLVDGEMRLLKPPLRYAIRAGALHVIAPA
jgi:diacylglycerol kinase family enzyme